MDVDIHIMRNFINCALQEMLFECLIEKGLDWRDMKRAWGNETLCQYAAFYSEILKRNHLGGLREDKCVKNWRPMKSIFEHDDGTKVNRKVEYLDQLNKYQC